VLQPDPEFACRINAELRLRLNGALDHLIIDVLGQPGLASRRFGGPAAHALQAEMRAAAVRDDVEAIRHLYAAHRSVLSLPEPVGPCNVVAWGSDELGGSASVLLQAAFRDDIGLTARLVAPDPQTVPAFRDSIAALRSSLAVATPLWCIELEELVSTVLLATTDGFGETFGGASAFAAWGAILVNPAANGTPRQLALTLIHESSHLKLFHAYLDDEIVLNDPGATYASPLRGEARPMNGVYHAAFVLARMILFSTDLLASGLADTTFGDGEAARLIDDLPRWIEAFDAAHSVIMAHGVLTPRGDAIIAEAATGVAAVSTRQRAA
jgi:HEXXH motif-containing protein